MFVSLTPNEDKVKEWEETREKCKKEYPDTDWDKYKPITEKELTSDDGKTKYPGFYIGDDHELYMFKEFSKDLTHSEKFEFFNLEAKFKSQYGVADNVEQIIEHYNREYSDPDRKFIILVTGYTLKTAEGEKFYKQGSYIGNCRSKNGLCRSEYSPSKITEEVKNNGYLIGFHIYPLPGTERYPSQKYNILKKYIMKDKTYVKGDYKVEILSHDPGNYWEHNGSVKIRVTNEGKVREDTETVFSLVNRIYNAQRFNYFY